MASDIVPIQLSLTEGDLVTLWAPRWREDGEEWEAFLGDDDSLFAFPEVAQLAAFVRTNTAHDLVDHPAWSVVPDLSVSELTPEDTQRYDIIGVPEIAAEEPDTWTVGELSEIVDILRSIAEVCDLQVVGEVFEAAPAFAMLNQGTLPFVGREGARLWSQLSDVVAKRWDEVVDAVDGMVRTPEVDASALAGAQKEVVADLDEDADTSPTPDDLDDAEIEAGAEIEPGAEIEGDETAAGTLVGDPAAAPVAQPPVGFWEEVGIDPVRITTDGGEYVTLRCYLNDKPVFLGSGGTIEVFGSESALARWIAEGPDDHDHGHDHDLTAASTWQEIVDTATAGDLDVVVDDLNAYVLTGLAADIGAGDLDVDPDQLDLATELLLDVGEWAGDDEVQRALAESQPLGWLISYLIRPDPTRLAPSPPFTTEAAKFRELVDELTARLREH